MIISEKQPSKKQLSAEVLYNFLNKLKSIFHEHLKSIFNFPFL